MSQSTTALDHNSEERSVGVGLSTARGVLYVGSAQTGLRVVGIAGTVILARLLTPADFGIYALTSFIVLQLGALADIGLGATLIHQAEEPSLRQLRSVFTIHALISLALYALCYLVAPELAKVLSLGEGGASFCRCAAMMVLLLPFRAIPAVLLNRRLTFKYIALSELIGGIVFQVTAIVLAFCGQSYWSFGVAILTSTAARSLFLYIWCPWPIGFALDVAFIRRCLSFGTAFQLSSLTALLRDNITNFLGGPLFGPTPVGLLSWASRTAAYCSQSYVGICANVSFPTLSRLRFDRELFADSLARMFYYVNLATMLTLSILAGLAPPIIHLIFTDKWLPALPLLYCFAIRMVAANYTTLLDLALKAQGRPQASLKIMASWTVFEWAGAVCASQIAGYRGIAISSAICIWFAVAWLAYEVAKTATLRLAPATVTPTLAGVATAGVLHFFFATWITTTWGLVLGAFSGAVLYMLICSASYGGRFWPELKVDILALFGREARTPVSV